MQVRIADQGLGSGNPNYDSTPTQEMLGSTARAVSNIAKLYPALLHGAREIPPGGKVPTVTDGRTSSNLATFNLPKSVV